MGYYLRVDSDNNRHDAERCDRPHRSAFLSLISLCSLLACAQLSDSTSVQPAGAETASSAIPGQACTPDSSKGCTTDGLSVVRCTPDGAGWQAEPCLSNAGMPSKCVDGSCLSCTPLSLRCASDARVEICNDHGTGWTTHIECSPETTGQVCRNGACIALCATNAKYKSYLGCEYWAADLDNAFEVQDDGSVLDAAGKPFAVIVSNPDPVLPMEVTIEDVHGPVTHRADGAPMPQGKVMPLSLRVYELPRKDVGTTTISALAYRIRTSIPALAYQFNPLADYDVFSNDASLLLPTNALGRWYIASSYPQTTEEYRGFLTVLGVSDNTTVTVRVTAHTLASDTVPAMAPGDSITVELAPFDVFNLSTDELGADLTGSKITATRAVAVFSGVEAADVPASGLCDTPHGVCKGDTSHSCSSHLECMHLRVCCADHLEQAQLPVSTWGQHYHAVKTQPRGDGMEVWRIMAANDDTIVSLVPPVASIPVLNSGEWFELITQADFEVFSSQPVALSQYLVGEHYPGPGTQSNDAGIGDPAFMIVPPVQQYRSEYVVLTPPSFSEDFINIVGPADAQVMLDGQELYLTEPFGTGNYMLARVPVSDGVHTISSTGPCAVSVYGWSNYVSYAYPGGLNLAPLNLATNTGLSP
ncbi:MAG: IgGFc-binding protein [Myxococcota bacterium]|nr:IgGFc-binding protein [Myxococcota bacterium]